MAGASNDEQEGSELEQDLVLLAKAYFDSNEFLRAAHTLRNARAARGRFLRWYSLFLAGEKRKDEEALEESTNAMTAAPTAKPRAVNEKLGTLHSELSVEAAAGRLDGYGLYVFALTLRELQRTDEAVAALKQSVGLAPCLWAAWCEIASLPPEADAVLVDYSNHWMAQFYKAHAAIESQQNTQVSCMCFGHGGVAACVR